MLVLTRKQNESIVVGDIRITIVRVRGGYVRLGIEAPASVPIFRDEILRRRAAANEANEHERREAT